MQKIWVFVLMAVSVPSAVADSSLGIHGVVIDNAGKPVRGAMVKATEGGKTVTRFTHADGRYEIALPAGTYDLTVEAYGFNPKREKDKDPSQAGETNFTLTPGFSVARLTSAELQRLPTAAMLWLTRITVRPLLATSFILPRHFF